ncbi:substrate-binding domain-containing protein [Verrucomicrobiota bacterium]
MDYATNLNLDWNVVPSPDRDIQSDIQRLQNARPPAVLIGRADPKGMIRHARSRGVKWVQWAYEGQVSQGDAAIMFDCASIGQAAADYLQRAGARSFAVQGPMPHPTATQRTLRHQAFMQAVESLGGSCQVLFQDRGSPVQWQDELRAFCNTMPHQIGFFLYHDDMAEHMIGMLREIGVDVPNEAMVVGCGNVSLAQSSQLSISSVNFPYYSMGVAGAAQAHRLLSGTTPDPVQIPAMGVVERGSTVAHAHGDRVVNSALWHAIRKDRPIPSVSALAQSCDVDRRVLHAHFQRWLRTTPKTWLMERAMHRACRLLAETDLSLTKIAHQCGIAYGTHLSAQFKKRFGMAPTSYRAQVRGL